MKNKKKITETQKIMQNVLKRLDEEEKSSSSHIYWSQIEIDACVSSLIEIHKNH